MKGMLFEWNSAFLQLCPGRGKEKIPRQLKEGTGYSIRAVI
jgi:hypothetical protein